MPAWGLLCLTWGAVVAAAEDLPRDAADNLARYPRETRPALSVDSTYSGYRPEVLTDGRWIAPGEETTQDHGSPDCLGNAGNSWVSAAQEGVEHWVRLDWPGPVRLNQVELWWTQDPWLPKAFRVEYRSDQSWATVIPGGQWFAATKRRSVVSFQHIQAQSIRVLQPASGDAERGLMAMQEVRAFGRLGAPPGVEGARELTREERRRLQPVVLQANLARLHEAQPGASRAVAWRATDPGAREGVVECPSLADGDSAAPAKVPARVKRVGVEWPVQHVVDRAVLCFPNRVPVAGSVSALIRNGDHWQPVRTGLKVTREVGRRRLVLAFEPLACEAFAFQLRTGCPRPAEVEVDRYLPEAPNRWPARLVTGNRFEKELLRSGHEASFETLSAVALSMSPARALLGLKDTPTEIGVAWDGTILAREEVSFSFGDREETLSRYFETVTRTLIDGWLPGTIVEGRVPNLRVKQTAFVSFADAGRTRPALFIRVEVVSLAKPGRTVRVRAKLTGQVQDESAPALSKGCLTRGDRLLMVASGEPALGGDARTPTVEVVASCPARIDLVVPYGVTVPATEAAAYRSARLDEALGTFRRYWDETLAPAAVVDLPEPRLNNLYRGVLTQLFINADGDVMPYGSQPSVYDGHLYGVEEGFAMMALASFGFSADAQRYLDGTYLMPEFLKKVPEYKTYPDRHQQYRNGLQPMYAVSAYRLSGDREWIGKHLDTLRQCAEWTIENRRKTMVRKDGRQPLHWGLLPKWSYGGDIADLQCYALYANFACWRGLHETAWLFEQLGDAETARRYRDEAAAYRELLDRVVEANYQPAHDPPFLPLRLYATEPVGDDYYQLFAGLLLDLLPLDLQGRQVRYLTDYLERANLTFCRLPRFRRDVGPGGLDGLYGLGYLLTKLHQDNVDEFLLGFYAYQAFNMERATFASRETNLIYASDLHRRSRYQVPDMSDPVPCSSAVAVLLLRHLLVTEQLDGPGLPSRQLRLLWGAPRAWFADGRRLRFADMPSHFGKVSCEVVSKAARGALEATVIPPSRDPWQALHVRLRHPDGARMKRVTVNGKPWGRVDRARELVTLLPGSPRYRIVAQY